LALLKVILVLSSIRAAPAFPHGNSIVTAPESAM
jgi:hypothetical protein